MDEIKRVKKVLYISYDGMTDPLGQSQVLPYIIGLTQHGYEFHLISFEKHERFLAHRNHIHSICDDAGIHWHPQDYHVEGGLRKTIRQVRKMNSVANYLHQRHNFSIVHCRSYISALAGLKLKRKHGVKFVFDMRGFWADERVDGKIWDLNSKLYRLIYNYFKRKEIQFIQEADYTISLTENGKVEIQSWKALKNTKANIEVIPCCVNLNLFDPRSVSETSKIELKEQLGITNSNFVLGYVGSIGTWYMLSEMLDYFVALKNVKPSAKFLFVTGESPNFIVQQATGKGISSSDVIITSVLHHHVPVHISLFDQSIFFIFPSYSKKASSPTKQGEIMAMGVPLICNSGVGDTDAIVKKYQSGLIIDKFNQDSYLEVINDPTELDATHISKGASDYFSLSEGVNRYLRVYKAIDG